MTDEILADGVILAVALLCPLSLIILLLGFVWALSIAFQESTIRLKLLHSIPCDRCAYYTGCHHLKCTVHPYVALTEEAANCPDFELSSLQRSRCSKRCKG
jgi:hypothetical protein